MIYHTAPRAVPLFLHLTAFVIVAGAFFARPEAAAADAKVTVTPQQVVAGQPVTVTGTGWLSHDQILVSFTDSSGNTLPLGVIAADANGNFQRTITVPPIVPPGTYAIDGNGQGGSVTVQITILAPSPTPAPPTPTAGPPRATPEPDQPTLTPTSTATDSPTPSPTETPTFTPTDTPTSTPTATSTATPTSTPTNTPTLPERLVTASEGSGVAGALALILVAGIGAYALWRRRR